MSSADETETQAAPQETLHPRAGACSDVGPVRRVNEDSVRTWQDLTPPPPLVVAGYLFAVADGVGGRDKGEVASALAIRTLFDTYYADDPGDPGAALTRAFERANTAIHTEGAAQGVDRAMASTLVAGVIRGTTLTVANVGDSRAYLFRVGADTRQISADHSVVAEAVRAGTMSEAEAAASPRNAITRALGAAETVAVDLHTVALWAGDIVVLCSDGLHGVVHAGQIGHMARDMPPAQAAADLVAIASAHGTRDNVSAVVVRVERDDATTTP